MDGSESEQSDGSNQMADAMAQLEEEVRERRGSPAVAGDKKESALTDRVMLAENL